MTREEAIKIINCYDIGFYDLSGEKIPADKLVEAFDMAIEALKQEPVVRCKDCISKPNNTCEVDLISREDAMGAVQDHFNADGFKGYYCKECKHRYEVECPMYHEEWFTIEEGDGWYDSDFRIIDETQDDGFCYQGEREEENFLKMEQTASQKEDDKV